MTNYTFVSLEELIADPQTEVVVKRRRPVLSTLFDVLSVTVFIPVLLYTAIFIVGACFLLWLAKYYDELGYTIVGLVQLIAYGEISI